MIFLFRLSSAQISNDLRFFLHLAYKGTAYHGWQFQNNALSVQEVLERSLSMLLGEKTAVVGCGRTDTGVHASSFYAHFDFDQILLGDLNKLKCKLNAVLPEDVAIYKCIQVGEDDHARFSATARAYEYHLHFEKDPFNNQTSLYCIHQLDFDKMNTAAALLLEENDFTSFCKLHGGNKTNRCNVKHAYWKNFGNKACFYIKADRFLRNMVRSIVGTLLDVGTGKTSIEEFKQIINKRDRGAAGKSVAGNALFLTEINYPFLEDE